MHRKGRGMNKFTIAFLISIISISILGFFPVYERAERGDFDTFFSAVKEIKSNLTLSIAGNPFGMNTRRKFTTTLISLSSWLRVHPNIILYIYGSYEEMGNYSHMLIETLQHNFGEERVIHRGAIKQRFHILSINELFEAVQEDSDSDYVAVINTDIILHPYFWDVLSITKYAMDPYENFSFHVDRANVPLRCRDKFTLEKVLSDEWDKELESIIRRCPVKVQQSGFDVFLWHRKTMNISETGMRPFFLGRPDFEQHVVECFNKKGIIVTANGFHESYHIAHPERKQWQFDRHNPDCTWNGILAHYTRAAYGYNRDLKYHITDKYLKVRDEGIYPHVLKDTKPFTKLSPDLLVFRNGSTYYL